MKSGLILVDIQNDYFAGGRMELVGMNAAAEKASRLLSYFRENQLQPCPAECECAYEREIMQTVSQ